MELRLLGPPELVSDGRSLDLGGPRQRIVLCMLALNANRVAPMEQLLDAVWSESPPTTARGSIQIAISALRKLLTDAGRPDTIKTRVPGYQLDVHPGELDIEQFHTLRVSGRVHAEADRLTEAAVDVRAALALWRGPALAGVPSELLQREAILLADHRRAAVEDRIRLDLALGRHDEISGELAAMVDAEPLRERLHCFLILALYRSGRQAEALEAGRRARAILLDEIGVDPGPELQGLEHAILNRDPGLDLSRIDTTMAVVAPVMRLAAPTDWQVVIPRQLPASIADFTGRGDQLAEIKRLLSTDGDEPDAPYAVRIVAISGHGGVGKSSLAVRAAHELSSSFPDGHLYAALHEPNGDDQTPRLLARFLRALGVAGTAIPQDPQERAELYRSKLDGKRLLVVLDDLTSEEQVLPLLPGSPTCAVITTSRARLSGLPGAYCIETEVFDTDQALEMLGRIIGEARLDAEPDPAVALVTFCCGLPLALRIAGARLAAKRHWRIAELVRRLGNEARRLDELTHHGLELRSNIGLTYRGLDPLAQRLFRLFALIRAPDFPAWTAAALLDIDLTDAEDVLESLVETHVLDAVEFPTDRLVRYRFHSLIWVYAWERLLETESERDREAALSRVLGAWLALAEEAHRKDYGGDYTILHGSAPRWWPADTPAAEVIGNPMTWWDVERRALVAAVREAANAGLDELCWDLALTSVTLFEGKGYFDDWRETSELAHDVAERAGNRKGRAAMLYSLGTLHMFQKRLDEAADCLDEALEIFRADGDAHGCGLVLRNAAYIDRLHGNTAAMLAKYNEALDKVRAVGDRIGEAHVLRSLAKFQIDEGDTDRATQLLEKALMISKETSCLRVEAQVLHQFAELYLRIDRIELARQGLHRVLRIVRDIGDRIGEAY
ncbi:MAG TPA: SARP family transcriptional regulator, partial [Micromonosporaceae bacterium]|nr:SARP family transcriptional regulator [Micromonosporaceae bacterium]